MTAEQRALIQTAVDDLRAAQDLMRTGANGFAIARAYHAMLCGAEALLLRDGLRFTTHAEVIPAFNREWVKTGRMPAEYYRYLIEAGDSQRMGIHVTVPAAAAEEALRHATTFLAHVWDVLRTTTAA
ncbi:MAG TPA: HEPN domain-containing protein [Armatimonadota bacterium]|nr:HEPN domain-containing protein [Armatimonadota bacterium]HOS42410.1 HEPN domain-containing protein [Armatimonadota bacterium]